MDGCKLVLIVCLHAMPIIMFHCLENNVTLLNLTYIIVILIDTIFMSLYKYNEEIYDLQNKCLNMSVHRERMWKYFLKCLDLAFLVAVIVVVGVIGITGLIEEMKNQEVVVMENNIKSTPVKGGKEIYNKEEKTTTYKVIDVE